MRQFVLTRLIEARDADLFERATENVLLEQRVLMLMHMEDVGISDWTRESTHMTRSISYVIPGARLLGLQALTKSANLSMSKFQDTFTDSERLIIEFKVYYNQTQAFSTVSVVLERVSDSSTEITITIRNGCNNSLISDQIEEAMEHYVVKEMTLWLDLLGELQAAQHVVPITSGVELLPLPSTPLSTATLRPMTAKSYTWSKSDLTELGEIEEMKVLSGGLTTLADELDLLRRTVESHYVRLCSLESHLTSQSLLSRQGSSSEPLVGTNGPTSETQSATASSSEPHLNSSQRDPSSNPMAFNSLEELEARQRRLRLELTSQMQSIEKSFLKQQQASQQLKTLESRWETMIEKMSKRLQEIDTLRYGLLGSWRYSVSLLCFCIFWPLICRYFWVNYGWAWARALAKRIPWRRKVVVKVPEPKTLTSTVVSALTNAPAVTQAASSAMSMISNAASAPALTQAASSAMNMISNTSAAAASLPGTPALTQAASSAASMISNAASTVTASAAPVLERLTFWK